MLDRRDLIKLSLGAALSKNAAQASPAPKFFTANEYALVDELTDVIIPTDEHSGGAKAAKVAEYIDQRLAEAFDSSERDLWRKQLASIDSKASAMHGATFLKCNPAQRVALVASLEKDPFWEPLKGATIRGYYSSKIGTHDEMEYKGNTYQQGEYAGSLPPHAAFPSVARARLAVASYPFLKRVPLLEFPEIAADRFGLHAIEPLDEHFLSTDSAYLDQLQAALAKSSTHVVNIPVGKLASFYDSDAERRTRAIAAARHWIDIASILGSPSVRVHIASAKNPPDAALAAASLAEVAAYGEKHNVVVHLENDDPKSEEAFFVVDVIKKANTPWLRALPDFCNSMLLERAGNYNYDAVTAMFDHAYGICHVKDSEQDGSKMFHVDLPRTFAIAKAAGYRGYFSMEYDAQGDPFAPTERLIADSLTVLEHNN